MEGNQNRTDSGESLASYMLTAGLLTKGGLGVACFLLVLVGCFMLLRSSDHTAFAPGPLAQAHSLFEKDCQQCHEQGWANVTDQACQSCHAGPVHQENQALTLSCVSCHREHRGTEAALTFVSERTCTQCHSDLSQQTQRPPQFAAAIRSFTDGHPEFAIAIPGSENDEPRRVRFSDAAAIHDTAQIHLNHALHLRPHILGPHGFEKLACESCHRLDPQGAYMQPITYEQHCRRCHSLTFDARFPEITVPHGEPALIHTFLIGTYTQALFVQNRTEPVPAPVYVRQRPGKTQTQQSPESLQQEITWRVAEAERLLFEWATCRTCHTLRESVDGALPTVAHPAIPQRWLPHSEFNHLAHIRAKLSCQHCHSTAQESQFTTDVLLPGIAVCQDCHASAGQVRFECMTCHEYHGRDNVTHRQSIVGTPKDRLS